MTLAGEDSTTHVRPNYGWEQLWPDTAHDMNVPLHTGAGSQNGSYNMHKSESEMKDAAGLVVYEWEQFLYAFCCSVEWNTGTGRDEYEDNCMKEVFLLHARALRDFYNRRRENLKSYEETDILAEDFFDESNRWISPAFDYLLTKRTQLNRALAHLSYDRLRYKENGDKNWDYRAITSELEGAFKAFLKALPEERRAWFRINSDLEKLSVSLLAVVHHR